MKLAARLRAYVLVALFCAFLPQANGAIVDLGDSDARSSTTVLCAAAQPQARPSPAIISA